MLEKLKGITIRKKLVVYAVVLIIMLLADSGIIELTPETADKIVTLSQWYFGGQGLADLGQYLGSKK